MNSAPSRSVLSCQRSGRSIAAMREALTERRAYLLVSSHEITRAVQQIIEVEHRGLAFESCVVAQHFVDLSRQRRDERSGDLTEQGAVATIHASEVSQRVVVQTSAFARTRHLLPSGFQLRGFRSKESRYCASPPRCKVWDWPTCLKIRRCRTSPPLNWFVCWKIGARHFQAITSTSRRHSSPAFALLIEALRFRG